MNLDMTFCSGNRCDKTSKCERFVGHIEKKCKEINFDITGRRISVGNFADHAGDCDKFIQLEKEK